MVMAIEPMVNEGTWDVVIDDDGWTARTGDGKLSAHFEHTVAVGEDGPEILTVTADGTDPILSLQ
jgi:methionyl aminopeptidase